MVTDNKTASAKPDANANAKSKVKPDAKSDMPDNKKPTAEKKPAAKTSAKKSKAGFLILGSKVNSTAISLLNLDHETSQTRCDSINSAYLKKF